MKSPVEISSQLITAAAGPVTAAAGKFLDQHTAAYNSRALRKIEMRVFTIDEAVMGNPNPIRPGVALMAIGAGSLNFVVRFMALDAPRIDRICNRACRPNNEGQNG